MAAPKTVLTYPLNGSKDFTIPFEYLARKFVVVTLIGTTRRTLVLNSEYRFSTKTTITTNVAWGSAQGFDSIELRRVTSATERLVDFSDGSILRAYDLNTSQIQSLHIAEEARDLTADTIGVNNNGDLDARGRKIVNVADGVLDGDAVSIGQNRRWAESALNQANRAESQATMSATQAAQATEQNRQALANNQQSNTNLLRTIENRQLAESAQSNSEAAREKSKQWAQAGEGFQVEPGLYSSFAWAKWAQYNANLAKSYSDQSKSDNDQSKASATAAQTQADRAKIEADKLGNMNNFAANLTYVNTGSPNWAVGFAGIVHAAKYSGSFAFVSQPSTAAPFYSYEGDLNTDSAYRPMWKQNGVNTASGKAWSLSQGVLTGSSGGAAVGATYISYGTDSAYFTMSPQGSFSAPQGYLSDKDGRVWGKGNFDPNYTLSGLGTLTTKGNYNVTAGVLYTNLTAVQQVYNGAIEIRENGQVGGSGPAPGHIYNAPGLTFHWGGSAVKKLMMNSAGALCWGDPNGEYVQIRSDGIITGAAYGGTLSGWVDSYYTPRAGLAAELVGRVNGGTLGNVALLQNTSGVNKGINDVQAGGLLFSSHNNVSSAAPGTWRCNGWCNNGGVSAWQRIA